MTNYLEMSEGKRGSREKGWGATVWKIISKCRYFEEDNKSTFKREKKADHTLRTL